MNDNDDHSIPQDFDQLSDEDKRKVLALIHSYFNPRAREERDDDHKEVNNG